MLIMLWFLGSKVTLFRVYLLCLCVGITSGSSHKDGPKFCAKAKKCTPCVVGICSDKDKDQRDRFGQFCCGSDAANTTQECRQLCVNYTSTNAVRYNAKRNESEVLCPANEILKECEENWYIPCKENMCTHFVARQVFLQQCFPKLEDQLFSEECKDLANQNSKSTTSSTKSSNETKNSTKDPSDKALINSEQQVGLFDEGDEVFIFYRGTTFKYMENSTENTFSWVAKVCKKSGLDCVGSGSNPTFFNGIYEVSRSDDLYFGLFQGDGKDKNRSAICTFHKADIEASFQEQDQDYSDLDNCTSCASKCSTSTDQQIKVNIRSVLVIHLFPYDVGYRKIAVSADFMGSRNIYVATDHGQIFLIFMKIFEKKRPLVVWHNMPKPFDKETPIQSMKLEGGILYIATDVDNTTLDLDSACQNFRFLQQHMYHQTG